MVIQMEIILISRISHVILLFNRHIQNFRNSVYYTGEGDSFDNLVEIATNNVYIESIPWLRT